ncbi:hypothetical protein [Rhizobium tubonense]|uniref:Uncharacterized protein n=1 Tax=Rhizobium tubonense TaxID=484088 RepID=A0A2W4CAE6_9HYPH|nr:hypothetical protein [Rhizobium tubonense]PZM10342.1 hypothetical protein CPY51_23615 [Rhizobium tubonense]
MKTFPDDIETALAAFIGTAQVDRDEAIRRIVGDWLSGHGYLRGSVSSDEGDISETVQYPEFMDDASGGAGG